MTELENLINEGEIIDFLEFYDNDRIVPVNKPPIATSPITPETPGFEQFTQKEIDEILKVEGS